MPLAKWNYNDLSEATGAPAAAGDPTGYTWTVDGSQHVVYRGTDNHIHELWLSGVAGRWSHNDLIQATAAPAAAGDPAGYTWAVDSTQHVIYRGTDNHIHELWFSLAGGWNHADLTQATGAPAAASSPTGYTWDVDSSEHVIYRGTDNHIHELWLSGAGGGWSHNDLTQATSAPAAASSPVGYTWAVDSTQHVIYRGTDNHIHELWFNLANGWSHNDLTQAAGAPAAAGDPAGYTWAVDSTQHVIYRGKDKFSPRLGRNVAHIHELWFNLASGWKHNDLTQATGAPDAVGDPAGYSWDIDGAQHVIYCVADDLFPEQGRIHELWFNLASGWKDNDLIQATWRPSGTPGAPGAPLAWSNPAAYTWDIDRTQHVVYWGGDRRHIYELWFSPA